MQREEGAGHPAPTQVEQASLRLVYVLMMAECILTSTSASRQRGRRTPLAETSSIANRQSDGQVTSRSLSSAWFDKQQIERRDEGFLGVLMLSR